MQTLEDLHHTTVIERSYSRLQSHQYSKAPMTLKRRRTFCDTWRITSSVTSEEWWKQNQHSCVISFGDIHVVGRHKELEIWKWLCTIDTWKQFQVEFKKTLFPINIIYEANHKLGSWSRQATLGRTWRSSTTFTFQIPNLNEDIFFHFMDEL